MKGDLTAKQIAEWSWTSVREHIYVDTPFQSFISGFVETPNEKELASAVNMWKNCVGKAQGRGVCPVTTMEDDWPGSEGKTDENSPRDSASSKSKGNPVNQVQQYDGAGNSNYRQPDRRPGDSRWVEEMIREEATRAWISCRTFVISTNILV